MKALLTAAFLTSLLFPLSAAAQKHTTIYIVRHAEKDLSDPANTNPPLNEAGLQRAASLSNVLKKKKITAVFSTHYTRNLQTAAPLCQRIKKDPTIYDPKKNDQLVEQIRKEFANKAVLIIGHSNTVLSIVKAFGGNPSLQEIRDDQYNLLFKLTLEPQSTVTELMTYGN